MSRSDVDVQSFDAGVPQRQGPALHSGSADVVGGAIAQGLGKLKQPIMGLMAGLSEEKTAKFSNKASRKLFELRTQEKGFAETKIGMNAMYDQWRKDGVSEKTISDVKRANAVGSLGITQVETPFGTMNRAKDGSLLSGEIGRSVTDAQHAAMGQVEEASNAFPEILNSVETNILKRLEADPEQYKEFTQTSVTFSRKLNALRLAANEAIDGKLFNGVGTEGGMEQVIATNKANVLARIDDVMGYIESGDFGILSNRSNKLTADNVYSNVGNSVRSAVVRMFMENNSELFHFTGIKPEDLTSTLNGYESSISDVSRIRNGSGDAGTKEAELKRREVVMATELSMQEKTHQLGMSEAQKKVMFSEPYIRAVSTLTESLASPVQARNIATMMLKPFKRVEFSNSLNAISDLKLGTAGVLNALAVAQSQLQATTRKEAAKLIVDVLELKNTRPIFYKENIGLMENIVKGSQIQIDGAVGKTIEELEQIISKGISNG